MKLTGRDLHHEINSLGSYGVVLDVRGDVGVEDKILAVAVGVVVFGPGGGIRD